ncbi:MAG TPA: poly-gamma-glutamate biosynthesis protein PgsC [Acidobacteriota bacterium]
MIETLFIGLLASLVYAELTGLYAGGIIVPAYLAFYFDQPARVGATLGAALLTLISYKILARYFLLFGRRRFVLMLLLGGLWVQAGLLLFPGIMAAPLEARVIGWVIPGLLANNLERQKILPTLASCVTVSVFTWFAARLMGLI